MIKLLMRFYDVNSGAIKIDGHDVRDFNRSELREMFGMVLQDTWLFHGTITGQYPVRKTGRNGGRSYPGSKGSTCSSVSYRHFRADMIWN